MPKVIEFGGREWAVEGVRYVGREEREEGEEWEEDNIIDPEKSPK